eukprot:scaffold8278_cov79-Skeletonema_dohrnii-CCMP3373.AAC.4
MGKRMKRQAQPQRPLAIRPRGAVGVENAFALSKEEERRRAEAKQNNESIIGRDVVASAAGLAEWPLCRVGGEISI